MLVPPQLPPFLATVFDLKPISGTPNAEEVKLVHAAIRSLSTFLHTPELRDSNLPMQLSQYLFDVQMTCYREKHPIGIFPNDIVYTPPSLPAHIPVKLEPVVGPPSDDEIRSAHAALRISENFTNVASLFDEDLSMQLSQHLFDLQLARHVQHSIRVKPSTGQLTPLQQHHTRTNPNTIDRLDEIHGTDTGVQGRETFPQDGNPVLATPEPANVKRLGGTQQGDRAVTHPHQEREWQDSAKMLGEIRAVLENINRVLVASQNSLAKGFNSSYFWNGTGYSLGVHSIVNDKGETPETHGLPKVHGTYTYNRIDFAQNLSTNILAQYLQFYGIGSELIEEGEELGIRAGMEEEAKRLLAQRVSVQ